MKVVLDGARAAVTLAVAPPEMEYVEALTVRAFGYTYFLTEILTTYLIFLLLFEVTVIFAFPAFFAVTLPFLTVATEVLEDL